MRDIKTFKDVWEACWTGYKQVGMKKKNGKNVPNCVPEETITEKKVKISKDGKERLVWDAELRTYLQMGWKVVKEDAPANAVAHGGVDMNPNGMHPLSKSHKKYKDENDAEAALRKLITKKFSNTVKENKETNSVMMNSILDQMDRLDVIVDNKTFGKTEVEFVEEPRKKTILEKANLKEYGAGGVGPLGSLGLGGGSYGAMHPIASLGDTPPKGRHRTMRSVGLVSQKDPRKGIDQSKKDFNLKVVAREDDARIPTKKGQPAGSDKHSDLYTDENPKGTIHGLGFTDKKKATQSVNKIKNSGKTHAHKIQAAIAMGQRAKVASKRAKDPEKKKDLGQASKVYQDFINKNKKGK